MTALQLSNISKRFGATVALEAVDLQLAEGEVHAIIGENGAGKSTLMNIIAGALKADSGAMQVNGQAYLPTSPLDARTHGIAFIHQELSLFAHLSVAENILMGIEPSRFGWVDKKLAKQQALEVLEKFIHPEIRPERRLADLPLSARQVVEISRALAQQARIILMDEPTSSLGREDVERLFALIRHLRADGISIIYISHFLEEVREIADSFTVLRDGQNVRSGDLRQTPNEELIRLMVGRSVDSLFPERKDSSKGETLLEVRDLCAPPVVKKASFALKRGEILGIAGLIGSGRTEAVRALFGLAPAQSGEFRLSAKTVVASNFDKTPASTERIGQGLGYLSEDRKGEGLALSLSIADNITQTRFATCSHQGWLNLAQQRQQAAAFIAQLKIKATTATAPVQTLSGGNQQKVALARLLHQDADIFLLDEPTRGIDIVSKAQVYELIAECARAGKAVLMVSSYLPELFGLCDRLAVMRRGQLSPARPIAEWTPETVMQAAISGE